MDLDLDIAVAETDVLRFENCSGGEVEFWRRNTGVHSSRIKSGKVSEFSNSILKWLLDHPKIR